MTVSAALAVIRSLGQTASVAPNAADVVRNVRRLIIEAVPSILVLVQPVQSAYQLRRE